MTTGGAALEPFGASRGDRRRPFRRAWMLPFAGVGILLLSLTFRANTPLVFAGLNDFLGIYAGARLVGSPEQFNADAYIREQVRATGWAAPAVLYTRLPAFAVVLRPLGKLEYLHAYVLWQALSLSSFAAFLIVWPFRDRALLLFAACWSFPLFADLIQGQDIAFLLLILAIASHLVRRAGFLAGAVLALAMLKFHLFLLVPVFLIAQRRWRMLAGASLTGGVILAVCFAAAGIQLAPEYARFVLQERTNPGVRVMPNLRGLLVGLPHDLAWETAISFVVALAVVWVGRRTSFSIGLSTALVGSLLTSHHAYLSDVLLLLPALLTLATEVPRVSVRLLCILLLSPLPFLVIPKVPLAGPAPLLLIALLAALVAWVATTPDAEQLSV
jgi:glycosyl transferase family 87